MKKITLILPYFGDKFPNTFNILVDSMYKNKNVNFLIFTNIDTNKIDRKETNVKFIHTTLEKVRQKASSIIGFEINLAKPYKLCDLKPFYGLIFQDYLKQSQWWGHFDSDIIFGDLSKFINDPVFDKYDKVFTDGPLTFYKNTPYINSLCMKDFKIKGAPTYKEVLSSSAIFGYDEWGKGKNRGRGMSWIIDKTNVISQYSNYSLFADILPERPTFVMNHGVVNDSKLICGERIRYFEYTKNGELIGTDFNGKKYNYLFAHFQKRNLKIEKISKDTNIFIYPNFISPNFITNYQITTSELKRWKNQYRQRKIKHLISHLTLDNLKLRIKFIGAEK